MSESTHRKKRKGRKYQYGGISHESPCCPSCHQEIKLLDTERCLNCDFSYAPDWRDEGFTPPALAPVMDEDGVLSSEEKVLFLKTFKEIEKKFPQFHFSLCLISFAEEIDLSVAGFHLLNDRKVAEGGASSSVAASTFLVMFDPKHNSLSVTMGYQIEAYLKRERIREGLVKVYAEMCEMKYESAALTFSKQMMEILMAARKRMERRTSKLRKAMKS